MDETTETGTGPGSGSGDGGMTDDEKRHDQLTSAPDATEADAAPRIEVSHRPGVTRIDIRDDAQVRPGNPEEEPAEG